MIHGPVITEAALLPVEQMPDDARNKVYREHLRRSAHEEMNAGCFIRLIVTYDPVLLSQRQKYNFE